MSQPSSTLFTELKLMRECPVCTRAYEGSEVHILDSAERSHLVHITCPKCKSAFVTLVVVSQLGMSSISTFTDLSVLDMIRMRGKVPMQEDDVLEWHRFLRERRRFESMIIG